MTPLIPGSWREHCRRGPCSGSTSQAMVQKGCYDMKGEFSFFTWNGSSVNFLKLYLAGNYGWRSEKSHQAPGQLPLPVVEGQWHRRHLNSIRLTMSQFLPVCLCCRPCSSDGRCASGSRCNGKASGYLSRMKWRQRKTNLLHRCQGSSRTCRSGSRGSPCRPRSTWPVAI